MIQLKYLKDVATLNLDEEKCIGCGTCIAVCPHAVFSMNGDKCVRITDHDACMECGACALNCPTDALTVNAGVGCAAAVINSLLGGGSSTGCSCSIEPNETCSSNKRPTCC
ncbi:MAG TPA: mercury methylation ferredoxin HgcB [Deltaproteobacteria bacterium]|nr:mercury methylation ferredoxin HgcB [Deltaproteobacteria bacterium]HPQ44079.1 mercury methylation ferredoxin HgcB [Syntrophales bacterium]